MLGARVFGVLAKDPCTLPPVSGGKADIIYVVRHNSLICAAENPVLQDFQPITALRAVIEYALYNKAAHIKVRQRIPPFIH